MNPKVLIPVAVGVALILLVAYLWYAAPQQYSQSKTVKLTFEDTPAWRQTVCLTGTSSGPGAWANVSFDWTTGKTGDVTLVIWNQGFIPDQSLYNATGHSGRSFFSAHGEEVFGAFEAPSASTVVTINMSYVLPGHVLGGPIASPPC